MEIQMRRKEIHQSGSLDLARSVFVCMCVGGGGGCMSWLGYQKRTKLRIEGLLTRSRVHSNIYLQSLLLPFRRTKIRKKTHKNYEENAKISAQGCIRFSIHEEEP